MHSRATSGEEQPLSANSNITLKLFNSCFSICKFSGVFRIERRNITLALLHLSNGGVRLAEFFLRFIALFFVGDGVITIMINSP
ncbi:hypothetical protein MP975_24300 [Escherichia coli]|nr:hypothetical protein [Escherichia coli]MCN2600879.1 hypothetical protein [Escherichia coli]MCT6121614.1 hypothetical protein [Escherichia coli]MCT6150261.1 hypothetical protein [Escherichia coli]MCT6302106.1 hypothetical protein [Escherichia coli]